MAKGTVGKAVKVKFYTKEVEAWVRGHMQKRLKSAAIIVSRTAKKNVRPGGPSGFKTSRGKAGLLGSIGYEVEGYEARVGTNLKYALIHEIGGWVRAKPGGALAIPIHPDAKKAKIGGLGGEETTTVRSEFPDLDFIPRGNLPPLLVRSRKGGGKRGKSTDLMFVLVKSTYLPPRPYLRPALYGKRAEITKVLLKPLPKTIRAKK